MRTAFFNDGFRQIYNGDSREVAPDLGVRFDAVVCDPPYEIGFMSKSWDRAGVAFEVETWKAILSVMKPGAHLIAFSSPRTVHRLVVAIEDAGFEIRDQLIWLYGSGMPKSLNIAKAIDSKLGAAPTVIGSRTKTESFSKPFAGEARDEAPWGEASIPITEPTTDEAKAWNGWGTGLKPCYEPIVLARRPVESTVAENVLLHGTGAINVGACRIGTDGGGTTCNRRDAEGRCLGHGNAGRSTTSETIHGPNTFGGRWPGNVLLDEQAAELLDREVGDNGGGFGGRDPNSGWGFNGTREGVGFGDAGGPSRFFYTAKASRSERDNGTEVLEGKTREEITGREVGSDGQKNGRAGITRQGRIGNHHPTVKPVSLMRWLIRLVCPKGGVVLDPFMGSGSTLVAAREDFVNAVGIDLDPEFCDIAKARLRQGALPFSEED